MARRKVGSRVGRVARLTGLTGRVSGAWLGQRVAGLFQDEDTRRDRRRAVVLQNAERVVETMGALKGAAMKVGQSLAQAAEGLDLPPEVGRVLGRLHDRAEPLPFEVVRATIEEELEAPLERLFRHFEEEPVGTASLGQAHAAELPDGTPVVVKALHPGIEETVATDLAALRALLAGGRALGRDRREVRGVLEEVRQRLAEEVDYLNEAANLAFFHRHLRVEGVSVPATFPSHCTARVLTMERIEGVPLDRFLELAGPEARRAAGDRLVACFHEMTYVLRALHADPHPGNYLFTPDGRVGLLDFGCVRRFDLYFVADYARAGVHLVAGRRRELVETARRLGCIEGGDPGAEDLLWDFCDILGQPFRVPWYVAGGEEDRIPQQLRALAPRFLRHPEVRATPEMLYLHRALGGLYAMLRKLRHGADYGSLFHRYAERVIAEAEGRLPGVAP